MQISLDVIKKLMELLNKGLCHGAGNMSNDAAYCVQQAVSIATGHMKSDRPSCINTDLRDLGIKMNDCGYWSNDTHRAAGLKRFAVAEMGTEEDFDIKDLARRLNEKLELGLLDYQTPHSVYEDWQNVSGARGLIGAVAVTYFANACADIMKEMGTPGSKYLHYCDEEYTRKEAKKIVKKETRKAFAAGLCTFGTCSTKPIAQ